MKLLLSLVLLVAVSAHAQPAARSEGPKLPFETFTLPNGLRVILHVDRKLPMVNVNTWFHVGSKNEKRGRTGFAHLFEHLMFEGSKNASASYWTYAENAGANVLEGGVNGTTNQDITNYFISAPSGSLQYLLWLESDRVATLRDALTQEKLDVQRAVVRNERRQYDESTPYGLWDVLIYEHLYPADHPYSWPVIGYDEDLTAATLDEARAFFARYYTPNNLSLTIAGDFDPAEARKLVEAYYGPIPAGPMLAHRKRWHASLSAEKVVNAYDRVTQERVFFAWPAPEIYSADQPALHMLANILGVGLESRLQKKLIYDEELATAVSATYYPREIAGEFVVNATAKPGVPLARIEELINSEIARVVKGGVTAEELERTRNRQEYRFISALERIGGRGGKADLLNSYQTFLKKPDYFDTELANYRAVTPEKLKEVASRWLHPEKRLIIRFHPDNSKNVEAVIDRTATPPLDDAAGFRAPEVKSATLDNGLQLLVVERRELPKVAVKFATRASSNAGPADKSGLGELVLRTIDMGTRTRTALQIENAFSTLGSFLEGVSGFETTEISFEILKRNLATGMAVFADVLRNPTFPENEIARERTRAIEAVKQTINDPVELAFRIQRPVTYGPNHPYGRPERGFPSTLAKITREDLANYHQAYYKPASSTIIFAGDITLDEATKLAETHFGTWGGGAAELLPVPEAKVAPGIYVVDNPGAAQTVITQVMIGASRSSADVWPIQLVDTILGGSAGGRLNLNLREDKGYSYGAYSLAIHFTDLGVWNTLGVVQTDKTKESVVEFIKELRHVGRERPITQQELDSAKRFRLRGHSSGFETLKRVTEQIADLWRTRTPMTELRREGEHIRAATLEKVRAVAAKYIANERSGLILVGDLPKIEAGLRELKLGHITVLNEEGKVIRTIKSE